MQSRRISWVVVGFLLPTSLVQAQTLPAQGERAAGPSWPASGGDTGRGPPEDVGVTETALRDAVERYCQMLCMSPDQAAFFLMPSTKGTPSITSVIN